MAVKHKISGFELIESDGKITIVKPFGDEVIFSCELGFQLFGFHLDRFTIIKDLKTGMHGLLDITECKVVIPCVYDNAGEAFLYQQIAFEKNGKWAYFNTNGYQLTPFVFDRVNLDYDWIAHCYYDIVSKDGLFGVFNYWGQLIIPFKWKQIEFNQIVDYAHLNELVAIHYPWSKFDDYYISKVLNDNFHYITFDQIRSYDYAVLTDSDNKKFVWNAFDNSIQPHTHRLPFMFDEDNLVSLRPEHCHQQLPSILKNTYVKR